MTLADPIDTILQQLSVAYLDKARAIATRELGSFGGGSVELVPAFFHPYKGNWFPDEDPTISELTPELDRSASFTGVGWTVLDLDETGLLHEDARLDVLLSVGGPSAGASWAVARGCASAEVIARRERA